jgi:acyl-CoA synthetase (AMP-forming)/AMP-acid ligase II
MLRTDLIASIPELLSRQASARGAKIAYEDVNGAVTYGDLQKRTGNLAGHLADLGIASGQFGRLGGMRIRDHARRRDQCTDQL